MLNTILERISSLNKDLEMAVLTYNKILGALEEAKKLYDLAKEAEKKVLEGEVIPAGQD